MSTFPCCTHPIPTPFPPSFQESLTSKFTETHIVFDEDKNGAENFIDEVIALFIIIRITCVAFY